jgi:hypothetical protein
MNVVQRLIPIDSNIAAIGEYLSHLLDEGNHPSQPPSLALLQGE